VDPPRYDPLPQPAPIPLYPDLLVSQYHTHLCVIERGSKVPRLFTPVPNVVKVLVKGTSSDLNWANVVHYHYIGAPPSLPSVTDLATALADAYVADLIPLTSPDASFTGITVTDLSSASSSVATVDDSTAGGAGGSALPASVAVLASYTTTLRYRGGHPRNYIFVGVEADLQDQSHWTTDFVSEVQGAWTSFLNAGIASLGGTTYDAYVAVSYRSADAYRTEPVVLSLTPPFCGPQIASQRRRMRRRT
jgi:hypothetical protein